MFYVMSACELVVGKRNIVNLPDRYALCCCDGSKPMLLGSVIPRLFDEGSMDEGSVFNVIYLQDDNCNSYGILWMRVLDAEILWELLFKRGFTDQPLDYVLSMVGKFCFTVFEFCRLIFDPGGHIFHQDLRTNLQQGREDDGNQPIQVPDPITRVKLEEEGTTGEARSKVGVATNEKLAEDIVSRPKAGGLHDRPSRLLLKGRQRSTPAFKNCSLFLSYAGSKPPAYMTAFRNCILYPLYAGSKPPAFHISGAGLECRTFI